MYLLFTLLKICTFYFVEDIQPNSLNVTCEDQRQALDTALTALGGLGKIDSLLSVSEDKSVIKIN